MGIHAPRVHEIFQTIAQTMEPLISPAVTDEQKEAVYRFRYDVYVVEMNRYRSIADHERRQLREDVDDCSRLYIVTEADKAVGALRFTWGGDAPVT